MQHNIAYIVRIRATVYTHYASSYATGKQDFSCICNSAVRD